MIILRVCLYLLTYNQIYHRHRYLDRDGEEWLINITKKEFMDKLIVSVVGHLKLIYILGCVTD